MRPHTAGCPAQLGYLSLTAAKRFGINLPTLTPTEHHWPSSSECPQQQDLPSRPGGVQERNGGAGQEAWDEANISPVLTSLDRFSDGQTSHHLVLQVVQNNGHPMHDFHPSLRLQPEHV
jgi:hypothetical protein